MSTQPSPANLHSSEETEKVCKEKFFCVFFLLKKKIKDSILKKKNIYFFLGFSMDKRTVKSGYT